MGAVGLDAIKMYEQRASDTSLSSTERAAAQAWLNRYAGSYIKESALDIQKKQVQIDTVAEKLKVQAQAAAKGQTWFTEFSGSSAEVAAEEQAMINEIIAGLNAGVYSYFPRKQTQSIYDYGGATQEFYNAALYSTAAQFAGSANAGLSMVAQDLMNKAIAGGAGSQTYTAPVSTAVYQTGTTDNVDWEGLQNYLQSLQDAMAGLSGYQGGGEGSGGGGGSLFDGEAGTTSISWRLIAIIIAIIIVIWYFLSGRAKTTYKAASRKVKKAVV